MSIKKSTNWFKAHSSDFFVRLSREQNYRSRAAYKLIELEKKYHLISESVSVIDLGSAPGSWLQVLSNFRNLKYILGVDRQELAEVEGVDIFQCDIRESLRIREILIKYNSRIDLVLSDIAPNISGIADVDQANFVEITECVLEVCEITLKNKGNLILKQFTGIRINDIKDLLLKCFDKVELFKPDSSKKNSRELYLVCFGYKDANIEESQIDIS